jgi:hypothetical protein
MYRFEIYCDAIKEYAENCIGTRVYVTANNEREALEKAEEIINREYYYIASVEEVEKEVDCPVHNSLPNPSQPLPIIN